MSSIAQHRCKEQVDSVLTSFVHFAADSNGICQRQVVTVERSKLPAQFIPDSDLDVRPGFKHQVSSIYLVGGGNIDSRVHDLILSAVRSELQFLSCGQCCTVDGRLHLLIDEYDIAEVDRERCKGQNHDHEHCGQDHDGPAP